MSGLELVARESAFARFMGEVEDLPELTVDAWRAAFYAGWEAREAQS